MDEIKLQVQEWIEAGMPYEQGVSIFYTIPNRPRNYDRSLNHPYYKIETHKRLLWLISKAIGNEKLYAENTEKIGAAPVVEEKKANVQDTAFLAAVSAVLQDKEHVYRVPFEDLPEKLQASILLKGELYNQFDQLKTELFSSADNSEDEINQRGAIIENMHAVMDNIKDIHAQLMAFEADPDAYVDEQPSDSEKPATDMSEAEIKLELIKLRKNLARQVKAAAESPKENIRTKNNDAAIGTQNRIYELEVAQNAIQPK